jgi:phage recombination protein Bet
MESLRFTEAEKSAFRSAYAPTATDEQFNLFIQECERRQLMPGKDVVFQLRTSSEWNAELRQKTFVKKVILITTIGGLRLIAERCGRYEGHGPFTFYYGTQDGDMRESKIPLGKIPHAVSVEGYRKDWKVPLFATARYDAYVQMQGKDDDRKPTQMWATRGEEQLAKCAEAAMLRTVAPEDCAGLYINEEMSEVVSKEDAPEVLVAPVAVPMPTLAPVVNQQPAPPPVPVVPDLQQEPQTIVFPPPAPPVHKVNIPAPTVLVVSTVVPEVSTPAPTPKPVSATVETAVKSETPATQKEVAEFLARAAKVMRDKLPKAGMKDQEASNGVKNYLLKQSGKPTFRVISAAVFENMLKTLEAGTPEETAAIVRAGCK